MLKGILFFIILCLIVLVGMNLGGILITIFDIPSLLIVLVGVLLLLYIAFPIADICEAIGFVFSGKKELPRVKYLKLIHLYQATGEYSLYCGLLGTFIGFMAVLITLEDPSTIGRNFSVAFITLFYGIIGKSLSNLALHKLNFCTVTQESSQIKHHKPLRSFFISLVFSVILFLLAVNLAGKLLKNFQNHVDITMVPNFVDLPSLLIVLGGSIFCALIFIRGSDIADAFKMAFSSVEKTAIEMQKSLKVFTQLNDIVASLMLLSSLAGIMTMLVTINDPFTIGPIMSISLLSIFYGIGLSIFIRGLYYIIQRRLSGMNEQFEVKPLFTFNIITFLSLALFLISMAILFVSIAMKK